MRKYLKIPVIILLLLLFSILSFHIIFKEEKSKEEIILENFIKENLREEYLPSRLNVIHKLTSNGSIEGLENLYGAFWSKENVTFYVNMHYNKDSNNTNISNLQIFIIANNIPDILDEEKASLLFSTYFKIKPKGTTQCKVNETETYILSFCENFWKEEKSKKGLVVVNSIVNNTKIKFIGICEFPIGGDDYKYNSCIRW